MKYQTLSRLVKATVKIRPTPVSFQESQYVFDVFQRALSVPIEVRTASGRKYRFREGLGRILDYQYKRKYRPYFFKSDRVDIAFEAKEPIDISDDGSTRETPVSDTQNESLDISKNLIISLLLRTRGMIRWKWYERYEELSEGISDNSADESTEIPFSGGNKHEQFEQKWSELLQNHGLELQDAPKLLLTERNEIEVTSQPLSPEETHNYPSVVIGPLDRISNPLEVFYDSSEPFSAFSTSESVKGLPLFMDTGDIGLNYPLKSREDHRALLGHPSRNARSAFEYQFAVSAIRIVSDARLLEFEAEAENNGEPEVKSDALDTLLGVRSPLLLTEKTVPVEMMEKVEKRLEELSNGRRKLWDEQLSGFPSFALRAGDSGIRRLGSSKEEASWRPEEKTRG